MPKEKTKEPAKREGLSINTVITVLGSITVALITSYFGYLGIVRKAETPTPTVALETATPTIVPANYQDLLSITRDSTCYSNYIPESLFEGQNKSDWLAKNYFPLYEEEELVYTPRMFDGNSDSPVYISYSISNAGTEPAWVRIEKEITLNVKYLQAPDPQVVDSTMPEGCGEGGDYRFFPSTDLRTDYPEYRLGLTAKDSPDYYKLEPGEFEVFVFTFQCTAPGLYSVNLGIPINYKGQDGQVTYTDTPNILCPQEAVTYGWFPGAVGEVIITQTQTFEWNGSVYALK